MSIVGRNVQHYVLVNLLEASSETQKIRIIEVSNVEEVKTKGKSNNSSKLQLILCDTRGNMQNEHLLIPPKDGCGCGICHAFYVCEILQSNHQMITQGAFNQISYGNSLDARSEFFPRNPRKNFSGILESTSRVVVLPSKGLILPKIGIIGDEKPAILKFRNMVSFLTKMVLRRSTIVRHVAKFYLVVRAHYDTDQTRFLIFDQIAETFLRKYANNLMREYNESLQLTSAEDCSESSLADTQTPKSKNGNQKIDAEDQQSVLNGLKRREKIIIFVRFTLGVNPRISLSLYTLSFFDFKVIHLSIMDDGETSSTILPKSKGGRPKKIIVGTNVSHIVHVMDLPSTTG
ncbi:hypothetical protein YC2023_052564 [Brassica napus]